MQSSPFLEIIMRRCAKVRRGLVFRPPEAGPFTIRKCRGSGRASPQLRNDWPDEHCANEPVGFLRGAATVAMLGLLALSFSLAAAVREVGAIELTVNDLNRELKFFTNTLPFQLRGITRTKCGAADDLLGLKNTELRTAELMLGDEHIRLTEHLRAKGRAIPTDSRSFDHWFQHIAIVVSDMDAAYEHLQRAKVKHVSTGPQTLPAWNRNAGGIKAFYFRDPEDHVLEIIWFPPGKGDAKWQRVVLGTGASNLFLGIDHTAIVVSDTERSLAFYTNLLGMRVVSGAENYGVEQEHLNQTFGARLRITALRAARGPGVEFLEYITPPGGRALPADATANDLVFWRTHLNADDVGAAVKGLRNGGARFISRSGESQSFITRDPDGHALQVSRLSALDN